MPSFKQIATISVIAILAIIVAQQVPVVSDYVSGNRRLAGAGDKAAA